MSDAEIDHGESLSVDDKPDYAKRKYRILLLMTLVAVAEGVLYCFLPEENDRGTDLILTLPYLVLSVAWCFADAAERDFQIGRLLRLVLILMFGVGFPIYLLRTRGICGLVTLGKALLLVLMLGVVEDVAYNAMLHAGEAMGLWYLM